MSIINDNTKHFHEERVIDTSEFGDDEHAKLSQEIKDGKWFIQLIGSDLCHIYRPVDIEATAKAIVTSIEDDISDRRGLRHEWDQIDEEIQDEIRARWFDRIMQILLTCEIAEPDNES